MCNYEQKDDKLLKEEALASLNQLMKKGLSERQKKRSKTHDIRFQEQRIKGNWKTIPNGKLKLW
jgi:hypothetical protein